VEEVEMMAKILLQEQWNKFQLERVQNICEWYQEHYKHPQNNDPIIKYIILWSVFNALYNTSDLPNNHLPEKINGRYRFYDRDGYKLPAIIVNGDSDRVKKIAKKLADLDTFTALFDQPKLRRRIRIFVDRIPTVTQDERIDVNRAMPIAFKKNKQLIEEEFVPASIRGVASLDNRLFLTDGYKFFVYASIDKPSYKDGKLIDKEKTTKQLLNVLYQLRNNVVHGGTAASIKKEIILDALPILQAIVEFIFDNRDEIYKGEK
jgi:Apea-like HEPN